MCLPCSGATCAPGQAAWTSASWQQVHLAWPALVVPGEEAPADPALAPDLPSCLLAADQERNGGVGGGRRPDTGWCFRWRYWCGKCGGGWLLLPAASAHQAATRPVAGFWGPPHRCWREARTSSHPPVTGRVWLWLSTVLWSRSVCLQPGWD